VEVETQSHRARRKKIEGRDLRSIEIFQDWEESQSSGGGATTVIRSAVEERYGPLEPASRQ
jgi:hypothetical protein